LAVVVVEEDILHLLVEMVVLVVVALVDRTLRLQKHLQELEIRVLVTLVVVVVPVDLMMLEHLQVDLVS
jgi:hypothetical protein